MPTKAASPAMPISMGTAAGSALAARLQLPAPGLAPPRPACMGIGTALIGSCVDVASNLGHPRLYVSTIILGDLLKSMGWQKMGETKFLNDEHGSVYVHDL